MPGEGPSQSTRLARRGSRLATTLLTVVVAFLLAGLALGDRALVRFDRAEQARISRHTVHDFGAALRLDAVSALAAMTEPTVGAVPPGLAAVGVFRVWAVDSLGAIVRARPPLVSGDLGPREAAMRAALPRLDREGDPLAAGVIRPPGGAPLLIVLLSAPDRPRYPVVGAEVDASRILGAIAAADSEIVAVGLAAGSDTIAPASARRSGPRSVVPVPYAVDSTWRLILTLRAERRRLRPALWAMGLGLLFLLGLAVTHERRQSRRIAERSEDLERLSGDLLRANRVKNEFLAAVSHELRTPLNAIVGFADLLRDGAYGELAPRQISPVQRIEASANHLRHLVDQMLDLAKMAAGRLEVHREILDVRPFVLEVASEMESLVAERGLSLQLSVGASLPRLRTDPAHLRQILVNLLGNAVKYTPKGTVAVKAAVAEAPPIQAERGAGRAAGRWMAVQVADTGIGIAAADQARIFEEFEQVNAGSRGDSMRRGTGLGLPISRRLARLLGGDITLESAPGAGSTFTLWLPIDPADAAAARG
jgi:signal transduction histidine kinase